MLLDPNMPAPRPGPRMEFWTPMNKQPEPVICCSARIVAHSIHFEKRTIPCTLQKNADGEITSPCVCLEREIPTRWRGYLHVYRMHKQTSEFLCLPQGTGFALQQQYGMDFDFRGLVLNVHRQGGAKNKPLIVVPDPHAQRRTSVPGELDPSPYLDTIFRKRAVMTPSA